MTRPESSVTPVGDEPNPDPLIAAIEEFVDAHDAAETTFSRILDTAQSLAYWSAHTGLEASAADLTSWRALLARNSPDRQMNRSTATEMLDSLSEMARTDIPGFRGKAEQLRVEVFRLLVYGRGLQHNISIALQFF